MPRGSASSKKTMKELRAELKACEAAIERAKAARAKRETKRKAEEKKKKKKKKKKEKKEKEDEEYEEVTVRGPISESKFTSRRTWNGVHKTIYLFGDWHVKKSTCGKGSVDFGKFLVREITDNPFTPFDVFFEVGPEHVESERNYMFEANKAFKTCKDCDFHNARVHWADARLLRTPFYDLEWYIFYMSMPSGLEKMGRFYSEKNALLWRLLHPEKSDTAATQTELILKQFDKTVVPIGQVWRGRANGKVHKQLLSNLPAEVAKLLREYLDLLVKRIRQAAQKLGSELIFPKDIVRRIQGYDAAVESLRYFNSIPPGDPHHTSAQGLVAEYRQKVEKYGKPLAADLLKLSDQFYGYRFFNAETLASKRLPLRQLIMALLLWQMDAYLFARMFRQFRHVGTKPIDAERNSTNIIVYAGDDHIELYKSWLAQLGFKKVLDRRSDDDKSSYQCIDIETPMF